MKSVHSHGVSRGEVAPILFDFWPVSDKFGVWRYGASLLRNLLRSTRGKSAEWLVASNEHNAPDIREICDNARNVQVEVFPSRKGFFRMNEDLSDFIRERRPCVYFTPDYLGISPLPDQSFIVVHDVFRIEQPELGYSDADFLARFGTKEFEQLCLLAGDATARNGFLFSSAFLHMQHRAVASSSAVGVPSASTREKVLSRWPEFEDKLQLLPTSFDASWFGQGNSLGFPELNRENFLLFVAGSNRRHKRMTFVLNAFAESGALKSGLRMQCVGTRDPTISLPEGVDWREGVADVELGCLYRSCAAVVVGSEEEGFCLPALEARGFGKPLIAPDIPVIRESYGDGANFYPTYDGSSLAVAFRDCANGKLQTDSNLIPFEQFEEQWMEITDRWWELVDRVVKRACESRTR